MTKATTIVVSAAERSLAVELAGLDVDRGDTSWAAHGLCRDRGDNLMFPEAEPDSPAYERLARPARELCAACPVRELCRNYALENGEPAGIWGGLNEKEREQLRRAQGYRGATVTGVVALGHEPGAPAERGAA